MASQYLARGQKAAAAAFELVQKKVVPPVAEYYSATMAKNAEYVVKDPVAAEKLGKQLIYTNLAK